MGNILTSRHVSDHNPERYDGTTNEHGQRHGEGKYYFESGHYYVGNWRKGRMEGRGKYVCATGNSEDGWFYKNEYKGQEPNIKLRWKIFWGLVPDAPPTNISATVHRGYQSVRGREDNRNIPNAVSSVPTLTRPTRHVHKPKYDGKTNSKRKDTRSLTKEEMLERKQAKRQREAIRAKYNLKKIR